MRLSENENGGILHVYIGGIDVIVGSWRGSVVCAGVRLSVRWHVGWSARWVYREGEYRRHPCAHKRRSRADPQGSRGPDNSCHLTTSTGLYSGSFIGAPNWIWAGGTCRLCLDSTRVTHGHPASRELAPYHWSPGVIIH